MATIRAAGAAGVGAAATASAGSSAAGPSAVRRTARQTVDFSLKGPVAVTLDEMPVGPPGCSVVDLLFMGPSQVSELVFHNYYTAWLTVLVRMLVAAPGPAPPAPPPSTAAADHGLPAPDTAQAQGDAAGCAAPAACAPVAAPVQVQSEAGGKARKETGWVVAVARRVLMPSPHLEAGSHDFVSILATESAVPWAELVAMRLVLRQPSPSWHTFHVEEIHVFAEPPRRVLWTRRHAGGPALGLGLGPQAAPPPQPQQPLQAVAANAGSAPSAAPAAESACDSILLLLRHQTQAALRSSAPGAMSSYAASLAGSKSPATATGVRQVPAYEVNSLPPV